MTAARRIRLTIGVKLTGLIAILLLLSITTLGWSSTNLYIRDNTALIQQMNSDTASNLTQQLREFLEGAIQKHQLLSQSLASKTSIKADKDLEYLAVVEKSSEGLKITSNWKSERAEKISQTLLLNSLNMDSLFKGDLQLNFLSVADDFQTIVLGIPWVKKNETGFSHSIVSVIPMERFLRIFNENNLVTSFLVDSKGKLLIHPNPVGFSLGDNLSGVPIVKEFLKGQYNNGQIRYDDPFQKDSKLGAFKLVGIGGLAVISEVPEAKAFEAARRVGYRVLCLGLLILFQSFLYGYLFSDSITWPIQILVKATQKIASGDFRIRLKPRRGKDEMAHLFGAFNHMTEGLIERDRIKDTFNKFHNKEIAEKLLSGEVKLGGEKREAIIFFSDIRDFTTMCESLKPEQVLEMLNEYMTTMVSVIRAHGGIVDKYVGDAIMAIWGVPLAKDKFEELAIRACIDMRIELAKLNELRKSRSQPELRIGMGVNLGEVIAGNVGSEEKMEYTVLGDSVNLASRIESKTKEFGVDLLVAKNLQERLKDKFIFETCGETKVKGKAQAVELFKVTGYYDEQGKPVIVQTPYSSSEKSQASSGGLIDWDYSEAA